MKETLLTKESIEELKNFELDGKEIHSFIHYTTGSNSIYLQVEEKDFTVVSKRIIKKVLDTNPNLEVVQPVNFVGIKPFNCPAIIAVTFIYFKKKPFWK